MKAFLSILLLLSLFTVPVRAQLGMGGSPHPSAALDVQATDKAFYPPRLTTAQLGGHGHAGLCSAWHTQQQEGGSETPAGSNSGHGSRLQLSGWSVV